METALKWEGGPSIDEVQIILQSLRDMDQQLRRQILQQQEAIASSHVGHISLEIEQSIASTAQKTQT